MENYHEEPWKSKYLDIRSREAEIAKWNPCQTAVIFLIFKYISIIRKNKVYIFDSSKLLIF